MDHSIETLRKANCEYIHSIWKVLQAGGLESLPRDKQKLGKIMLEHEQYHNQFEIADLLHDHQYDINSEVNPFLHITLHEIAENQLESKEPIEVFQFYNAMKKHHISRHDIIHLIVMIFSPMLFQVLKNKVPFDNERYRYLLRRCKDKKPNAIESFLDREFK
jgi:hypothetical protein